MISVIVPVYNVEHYLRQCLNSIVNQTYRNLEIILIDDCSPDNCGKICDEFSRLDDRIRVFHNQTNSGLSAARNMGLEEAKGEYIGFIDSDDWIERDMYELLLNDIPEKGFIECKTQREKNILEFDTTNALNALLTGKISNMVWNKLYSAELFEDIRFPEGRNFEDVAVMHRIVNKADNITVLNKTLYHHRVRTNSIAHDHSAKNLIDYADAYLERYIYFYKEYPDIFHEHQADIIRGCIKGNAWVWRWWYGCSDSEKRHYKEKIEELTNFARDHFSFFMSGKNPLIYRMIIFFLKSKSKVSFRILYGINQIYENKKLKKRFSHMRY